MVAAGEGCLVDLDLQVNSILANLPPVQLPDGGSVEVLFTHIGGDHKNKQLNTGLLGGSSDQRQGMRLPIPSASNYLCIAYNSTVDGELASLADLAKAHIRALELFQELLEQAKQMRHNKKMDDVQAWQRIYAPSTAETLGRQVVRQLERVQQNPDMEWRSVYERLEEDAENERAKAERRCAREEKQKEERRKREANEKALVEAGARRSERRVRVSPPLLSI